MPSKSWKALGGPTVLGHLRADLARAEQVLLIGPWLDDHVAGAVVAAAPRTTHFRVLTRPYDAMDPGFVPHARAAHDALRATSRAEIRTLRTLHAKVIVIDAATAFCGSANWYRYSLETSKEIVLRGSADDASGLLDLAEGLWQAGGALENASTDFADAGVEAAGAEADRGKEFEPLKAGTGYRAEAMDPIAAQVLRDVKGTFVLGEKVAPGQPYRKR